MGVFASGGGLAMPIGLAFGPEGHLYVGTRSGNILRYNDSTGALMGVFVPAGSGGLSGSAFLTFTPRVKHLHSAIHLQDFVGDPTSVPVMLELRRVGETTPLETLMLSQDTTSRYTFNTMRSGRYDVSVKAS